MHERLECPDGLAGAVEGLRGPRGIEGVERPALEHETCYRAVAEESDTRDAHAGERFERRRLESRPVARDWKEHHDHRHVPLLSCAVQWRGR